MQQKDVDPVPWVPVSAKEDFTMCGAQDSEVEIEEPGSSVVGLVLGPFGRHLGPHLQATQGAQAACQRL